jgi:hypothetical protein
MIQQISWNRDILTLAIVVGVGMAATCAHGEQVLSTLRDSVWDESAENSSAPPPPAEPEEKKRKRFNGGCSYDNSSSDSSDNPITSFIAGSFLVGLTSPFWGPPVLLDDEYSDRGTFFSFPYKRGAMGTMNIEPSYSQFSKPWHVRLRGDFVDDFGSLSRAGGHILFDTSSRFGFDGELNYRTESIGQQTDDSLITGDFNFLFRFAQSEFLQMRTGLGVNWLDDGNRDASGFNFTYGGDWMPANPWIISTEIDWGRLGDAGLFHGRVTAGVHYRHIEVFTGYDYFDVGHAQIDGLVGGLRLWF